MPLCIRECAHGLAFCVRSCAHALACYDQFACTADCFTVCCHWRLVAGSTPLRLCPCTLARTLALLTCLLHPFHAAWPHNRKLLLLKGLAGADGSPYALAMAALRLQQRAHRVMRSRRCPICRHHAASSSPPRKPAHLQTLKRGRDRQKCCSQRMSGKPSAATLDLSGACLAPVHLLLHPAALLLVALLCMQPSMLVTAVEQCIAPAAAEAPSHWPAAQLAGQHAPYKQKSQR